MITIIASIEVDKSDKYQCHMFNLSVCHKELENTMSFLWKVKLQINPLESSDMDKENEGTCKN